MHRVLMIDDDEQFLSRMTSFLSNEYNVSHATGWTEGKKIFYEHTPDVVLLDYKLKDGYDGIEVLKELRNNGYGYLIVILVSAYLDEKIEKTALKLGADQCIFKGIDEEELGEKIAKAIDANLARRLMLIRERAAREEKIEPVFISAVMRNVRDMAERFMDLGENILITGPTGSGKEVLARWIHSKSIRANGPLCIVGLPELTPELFSKELFGHEKGSFTGAVEEREGLLELAHGGTMILDEIGEIPPSLQTNLLRILEGKTFRRIGGNSEIKVNVRFIALTNKNLYEEANKGTFREDLFFRLKTFHIDMPPLKERREDIPELAGQILKRVSKKFRSNVERLDESVMKLFLEYDWPGNVRELEEWIKNGVLYARGKVLRIDNIPLASAARRAVTSKTPANSNNEKMLEESIAFQLPFKEFKAKYEKAYIENLLEETAGDVNAATGRAAIPRESFYRLCRKYGLRPGDYRENG